MSGGRKRGAGPSAMSEAARARHRARKRVVQALYQWQVNPQPVDRIIGQFLAEQNFAGVDKGHFTEVLRQVVHQAEALDAALAVHCARPYTQLDQTERAVLRVGACELKNHPDIPYKVVINEAVEMARTFGAEESHGFINAVLDKLAAEWRKAEIAADGDE